MANSILKRAVIKEELVELTGNCAMAITLNQLLYWSKRVKDSDGLIAEELARISTNKVSDLRYGWIYKSSEELSQEIMLGSPSTVRRNLKELVNKKYIFERRNPNPRYKYDKTLQYRVNLVKIVEELNELGYRLEHFDIFYNDKVKSTDSSRQLLSESSNVQNEASISMTDSSDNQGARAIPENTTEIIYQELDDEDAKSATGRYFQDPFADQIARYFLMKSAKYVLTDSDRLSITQVAQLDLNLQTVTQLIDNCFNEFVPQHERDRIRSFAYVANYIFDKHHNFKKKLNHKQDNIQEEKSNGKTKRSIFANTKQSSGEVWFNRAKANGII
ncbi:hypothetical protein [Niallia sp. MER 6]|uniref:hypothetical protein n=1 Tax=Niallia sp. MER 6 TaxID=2939567 RepID=UPI00203BF1FB|nr:hypothetical protein [Niallia sp. MER 6]MCM3034259.1 hypothetical protein [Niallia sp. MER 6]